MDRAGSLKSGESWRRVVFTQFDDEGDDKRDNAGGEKGLSRDAVRKGVDKEIERCHFAF